MPTKPEPTMLQTSINKLLRLPKSKSDHKLVLTYLEDHKNDVTTLWNIYGLPPNDFGMEYKSGKNFYSWTGSKESCTEKANMILAILADKGTIHRLYLVRLEETLVQEFVVSSVMV